MGHGNGLEIETSVETDPARSHDFCVRNAKKYSI